MKTIVFFDRHQLLLFADSDQLLHRQSCSRWRHSRHVLHSISGGNNTHQLSEYYGLQDIIINIIIRIVFKNHLTWDCQFCGVFMKILKISVLKSIEIRIMVRLSRFSSWVTIHRFSLLMFLPLSVQSSTCSTLGPASLHVPVLSFCTDFVGQLVFLHGICRWAVILFAHILWGSFVFLHKSCWWTVFFSQKVNIRINISLVEY